MNPLELVNMLKVRPFEPFRLHLADSTHYDIRHPEMMIVGPRTAVVGVATNPQQGWFDTLITVSLLHIVRVEPIQQTAAS